MINHNVTYKLALNESPPSPSPQPKPSIRFSLSTVIATRCFKLKMRFKPNLPLTYFLRV